MEYVIDRIEGGVAVCTSPSGKVRKIKTADITPAAKAGAVIEKKTGGKYAVNEEKTEKLRRRNFEKAQALFNTDK